MLNRGLGVTDAEAKRAEPMVAAFEAIFAGNPSLVPFKDAMIDAAVVERAKNVLTARRRSGKVRRNK